MKVGLLFSRKTELLRDAHADDAGPVGVAVRVPLGEVERVAQPGYDGDQRNSEPARGAAGASEPMRPLQQARPRNS